jgi:prepilin-type N-terminal cleavage/methylation domain-containing protein
MLQFKYNTILMHNYKTKTKIRNITVNKGFTIIELLISIVISSIIALGIGGVYLNIRNTQNAQMSVNEIRDSIFIAFERLEYVLKHAHYKEYTVFNPNESITIAANSTAISAPFSSATTINASVTNASDEFAVQMTGTSSSNQMIDCTGQAIPNNSANQIVEQRFFIKNNRLLCSVTINGKASNEIALTDGIENMQIFYALDTPSGNGCGTAATSNAWITAAEVNTANAWGDICAINLGVLFSSTSKQVLNAKELAANKALTFDLRPNTSVNDNVAKKITIPNTSNIIKNTRIMHKIIRLRN